MNLKKGTYDRRLYNTRLLLRNYTKFKQHVSNAIQSSDEIRDIENQFLELEILDKPDTYINSILRTKERTKIMIAHIDRLIKVYKSEAESNDDQEQMMKYEIIYHRYIAKNKKSIKQMSIELNLSERTAYRVEERAIKDLSVLFFGVDAISIVSKV